MGSGAVSPAPPPPLSTGRKWLFRFLTVVLLPLLALALLEAGLRLAGYGYPTGFFERARFDGRDYLVNNETFSLRFFPPHLARWPGPIMMEAAKPTNTFRIFILGESAARGEPEPAYAAGRYLQTLLSERFPGERFEVVNLGITAINSHVILPIARDCAHAGGDVWIVYMGNNEMVGPFGAVTVFGARAPPLWSVRLGLAVQRTRVGQLLMALARAVHGKSANASWGGMKMFLDNQIPPDDPDEDVVYHSFQRNLDDILRVGRSGGAKIILNTVAVNLKDCPPFASWPATNLPAAVKAQFDSLYAEACGAEDGSRLEEAAARFQQAAGLDSRVAALQYRWGDCLLRLTNAAAAAPHFQQACDLDSLPFRATSRINDIIREAGRRLAGTGLVFFDAAAALSADSPSGIPGDELFFEHVHFTFEGNYRLGLAWAGQVARLLPPSVARRDTGGWPSRDACDRRLGLTDWNRCAVLDSVIWRLQRPPMSGQSNNPQRLQTLRREEQALRERLNATTARAALETYEEAIRRAPGDHYLYENFAEFLESGGDLKGATRQWQEVCRLLPFSAFGFYQVGRLLETQGQYAEAEPRLTRALALRPALADAWFELGRVHLAAQRFEPAFSAFDQACRLEPRDATYLAFAAQALSKLTRHAAAVDTYRQALELEPDFCQARLALADELVAEQRIHEAQAEYAEVIRQQPTNVLAHIDLGVMLARQGQFDAALREFEETLRLEPENTVAREYLERVRGWKAQQR